MVRVPRNNHAVSDETRRSDEVSSGTWQHGTAAEGGDGKVIHHFLFTPFQRGNTPRGGQLYETMRPLNRMPRPLADGGESGWVFSQGQQRRAAQGVVQHHLRGHGLLRGGDEAGPRAEERGGAEA